jgi:plastocyanin
MTHSRVDCPLCITGSPQRAAKVGEIIEWDWLAEDIDTHNVLFATQVKFTRAGTYGFVCTFHAGSMTGLVEVTS